MNSFRRLVAACVVAFGIAGAAPAHAACDLQAISAFTSVPVAGAEAPYTPRIGEDYRLTFKYRIVGTPTWIFLIRFEIGGQKKDIVVVNLTAGEKQVTHNFGKLALDGPIPFKVTLDPSHSAGETGWNPWANNAWAGTLTPVVPSKSIDYYEPHTMVGAQSIFEYLSSPLPYFPNYHSIMMGKPTTESWQKVISASCSVEAPTGDFYPAGTPSNVAYYPAYFWKQNSVPSGNVSMIQQFEIESRNVRVDANKLRTVTWAQMDALSGINAFSFYKSPEPVVQSTAPEINQFVLNTLGPNHRSTHTPYDAARKLFRAVLKRVVYVTPSPSHSAVATYVNKTGDCGSFSLLIVAALRNVGIPARTACGVWQGQDAGHCWSECYFPGHGWVISDGSAGNALSEDGAYAYFFGNIPNMNVRVAFMRGNTFSVAGITHSWLQGPQTKGLNVVATNVSIHTAVVPK